MKRRARIRRVLGNSPTPPAKIPARIDPVIILGVFSQQGGGGGPELCTISLTGDYVGGFGLAPANIAGQTFSITAGSGGYGASTDVTNPTPAWTGKRIVEIGDFSGNGLANIRAGIVLPNGSKGIFFELLSTGQQEFSLETPVGTTIDATATDENPANIYAVGVDLPSGDVTIYINGVESGGVAPYTGFFAGATGLSLLGLIEASAGGTASMEFVTEGSLYAATYPAGAQDWCGNTLGV